MEAQCWYCKDVKDFGELTYVKVIDTLQLVCRHPCEDEIENTLRGEREYKAVA